MTRRTVVLIALGTVAILAGVAVTRSSIVSHTADTLSPVPDGSVARPMSPEPMLGDGTAPTGNPTFTWKFSPHDEGEIPYTDIALEARYPDGTQRVAQLGTIEGGCNAYEPKDADAYERADMLICYYAGLGRYYKVVATGREYLVQRRIFEEGSPEYEPPVREYETIARF